ncbi:DUF4178 domain-containing protein [Ferruginibacter sp.]
MNQPRTILQCPACAAMVAFEWTSSNLKECTCGRVLVKNNNTLTAENRLNAVTVKGYQIKPGTTGEWDDKTFSVLGKMGVWFEESFFSYWFIVFSNGTTGFLAEGYGLYSILQPEKNEVLNKTNLAVSSIGKTVNATNMQLQKKNSCYYWEVEGEIQVDDFSTYFDVYEYATTGGMLYTMFHWKENNIDTFINYPVSFDELKLKNIQQKNPFGKELQCPQCSKAIKLVTYPLAQSCTCSNCGNFYAIEKSAPVKKGNTKNKQLDPLLAIGSKGILKDIPYEVVGFTQKQEQNAYKAKWREYVLFNPTYGFAFLSEFDGHWIYVKETLSSPVILNDNTKAFELDKTVFRLFNSYSYIVIDAKGEFPYNAFDNKNAQVKEYIAPPEIWIKEKDSSEGISWFFGKHIDKGTIEKAFTPKGPMPYKRGVGAVQPTGHIKPARLITATLIGILALMLIQVLLLANKEERVISEGNYYFSDTVYTQKIVTEKFDLDKWRSTVAFNINAPVSNTWFELNATLVNVETGKEYSMEQGVEFYSGYTDGENWSEGGQNETGYITGIPAGKYFLEMVGTRENSSSSTLRGFSVKAVYDENSYRNFWFAVLLLLIWPAANYFTNRYKEQARWQDSAYANYNSD